MALFKVFRGEKEALEALKITDGYAYFTPENGKFYIDISSEDGVAPIFGYDTRDGANRICINEGSIAFNNLLIVDCGTAKAEGEEPTVETLYFSGGDSTAVINENTILLICGDSSNLATDENTLIYAYGDSSTI